MNIAKEVFGSFRSFRLLQQVARFVSPKFPAQSETHFFWFSGGRRQPTTKKTGPALGAAFKAAGLSARASQRGLHFPDDRLVRARHQREDHHGPRGDQGVPTRSGVGMLPRPFAPFSCVCFLVASSFRQSKRGVGKRSGPSLLLFWGMFGG